MMSWIGETDIAMLEDDERFLLDSIDMLLLGYCRRL